MDRCKRCKGQGAITAQPDDYPAEWLSCPDCEGTGEDFSVPEDGNENEPVIKDS